MLLPPKLDELVDDEVEELVEELVESLRGGQGEWHQGISFQTQFLLDSSRVWADGQLLRRVLENLLDNALRYSPTEACIRIEVSRSGRESASVADRPTFQLLPPPVWARKPVTTNFSRVGAIFHSARSPL